MDNLLTFNDPFIERNVLAGALPLGLAIVLALLALLGSRKIDRPMVKWSLATAIVPLVVVGGIWLQRWRWVTLVEGQTPPRYLAIYLGLTLLVATWYVGTIVTRLGEVARWIGTVATTAAGAAIAWDIATAISFDDTNPLYPQLAAFYTGSAIAILLPLAQRRHSAIGMFGLCSIGGVSALACLFTGSETGMWIGLCMTAATAGVSLVALPSHGLDRRQLRRSRTDDDVEPPHDKPMIDGLLAGGLVLGVALPILLLQAWIPTQGRIESWAWALAIPMLALPGMWLGQLTPLRLRWFGGVVVLVVLGIAALGGLVATTGQTDLESYDGLQWLEPYDYDFDPAKAEDGDGSSTSESDYWSGQ